MVDIARRNLFQEKLRFILSSGGVALAIMLIIILNGFYAGLNRQVTAYLDNTPINLIVAQKGLRNFLGTSSIVPLKEEQKIKKVKGVKKVIPVFVSYAVLEIKGRKIFALLIGFNKEKGGGPWKVLKGRSSINDNEMIYDETAAKRSHLMLGDKVSILGKKFKIVGFSGGTSSFMTGTTFITFKAAAQLKRSVNSSGFFLVQSEKKITDNSLRKKIKDKIPGLSVENKKTIAKNDVELFAGVFNGPLRLMVIIAFLIGLMLVGLTIYTETVQRSKEYGVLKALGMKNLKLYLVVFEQAVISSLVGFIAGVGLSLILIKIIGILAPQFLILVEPVYVLGLLPLAIFIGILASYMPIRAIAKIDPAIAFSRGA